jgi:hypothetical protein
MPFGPHPAYTQDGGHRQQQCQKSFIGPGHIRLLPILFRD